MRLQNLGTDEFVWQDLNPESPEDYSFSQCIDSTGCYACYVSFESPGTFDLTFGVETIHSGGIDNLNGYTYDT
jgi:hypothetical protein